MKPVTARGSALIVAVIMLAVLMTVSSALYVALHQAIGVMGGNGRNQACFNLAEAGIEKAVAELRAGKPYRGEKGTPLGEGCFTVEVRRLARDAVIVSTGYLPAPVRASVTLTARATLDGADLTRYALCEGGAK